jgi:uncharacterized membrane protein required for colicin V production
MALDIALLVLLALAGWLGFRKSAFRFVLPLLEWVVGLYLLMKLTPPVLAFIHRILNPEPRMAFLFAFIALAVGIYYLMYRVNDYAADYFEGKGGGRTGNIVKAVTAVVLVMLVSGWIVNGLDRQGWLPAAVRDSSHAYPVIRSVSRGTGEATGEFARTFDTFSRTIGEAFRPPDPGPAN